MVELTVIQQCRPDAASDAIAGAYRGTMKTKTIAVLVLSGCLLALGLFGAPSAASYSQKEDEIKEEIERIERVEDALDAWINELARFECEGCGTRYRRLDSNNKYSYSCLQFQEATFREMVRLYDPSLPHELFGEIIYDCSYQKQLARAMFEDQGVKASRHWYTSIYKRGLGEPPVGY